MGAIAGWVSSTAKGEMRDSAGLMPMLQRLAHRAGTAELSGFVDRRKKCQVVLGASLYDKHSGIALVLDGAIANRDELKAWFSKRGQKAKDDAELLLRAYQYWDKDAVKHLRGAFAFALWDGRKERLLLARDRFGEKPLYLRETNGTLIFASEAKALADGDAEVDLDAVWEHLACRYVPGPRTLLKGIRKLPPASYALWQFGKLHETRYWVSPDQKPSNDEPSIVDPVDGFIQRLDEAVKLSLPGGVFLSGGIDSAAIVALATQGGASIATFSAGFAEDKASELPAAARAAKHFGTQHHELILSRKEIFDRLPQLVAMRDAPLSRPSDVALHLLAMHAARVTPVVLTGEGGDEVLGGYRRHATERFAWAFRGLPTVLALLAPLSGASSSRMRDAAASLPLEDWRERTQRWNGGLTGPEREHLLVLQNRNSFVEASAADPAASALRRVLFFEQTSSLPDNLLERADRMTMNASVEARAPFLDHRLIEYVSALPDALRVRGMSTKWILRRALARLVPARALTLKKGGWLPGGTLRGALGDMARDHLTGAASRTRAYYEPKVLDRVLDEHGKGRGQHEELLWTLLNLEIWHRAQSPARA
jgi:asparagine synthase (glutamine-hydrolysing)